MATSHASATGAAPSLVGLPRIAYLFSAPLIQRIGGRVERVEPLDVNKERRQLRQVVAHSNRRVIWSQAVATISNFRNAVTMGALLALRWSLGRPPAPPYILTGERGSVAVFARCHVRAICAQVAEHCTSRATASQAS